MWRCFAFLTYKILQEKSQLRNFARYFNNLFTY